VVAMVNGHTVKEVGRKPAIVTKPILKTLVSPECSNAEQSPVDSMQAEAQKYHKYEAPYAGRICS
jgi:hypothetical protein